MKENDTPTSTPGLETARRFPLVEALFGRRSRRFPLGGQIPDGPFRDASRDGPSLYRAFIFIDSMKIHLTMTKMFFFETYIYEIPEHAVQRVGRFRIREPEGRQHRTRRP